MTNSRGDRVSNYTVVLFPEDRQLWEIQGRATSSRPDQEGQFRVTGLRSGSYYAAAVEYVDAAEIANPEYLDRLAQRATRFSLREGETRTLDLKLMTDR